ncbi:hypothetical protein J6590_075638 [Homalodisca vitripennis]|nr:hypothetical protein J6590_075638 [Homalodisca vitripennis]
MTVHKVYNGGKWCSVGHLPGAILVNLGELIENWSSSRYKAIMTVHKVYNGGKWCSVGHLPGAILVNLGELIESWSSSRYKAIMTVHKVYNGGKWCSVGHLPGAILVNLGELIESWSSSRYKAIVFGLAIIESVLLCEAFCNKRYHAACINIDDDKYGLILSLKDSVKWVCERCETSRPLTRSQSKNVALKQRGANNQIDHVEGYTAEEISDPDVVTGENKNGSPEVLSPKNITSANNDTRPGQSDVCSSENDSNSIEEQTYSKVVNSRTWKKKSLIYNITNIVCEEIKPKYDTYKPFKIGVCEEVFETVLDPEFWDEGVLVKKYVPPRRYIGLIIF